MDLAPRQQFSRSQIVALASAWAAVFLATVFAYFPGLSGPFMLDDYGSIAALANHGGVVDWQSFKAFVFGGNSGPTGRPISLVTFLIDGNNWPTDSGSFKRTNLIIHMMTGVLLGVLINRVLRILQFDRRAALWIALISAAGWLLHPFLVSTTLYVVQRMAQLATLFILAGLLAYLHGRSLLATDTKKAYLWMSVSVPFFTLLAILSKENGILLPVLIGVIEITVIASQRARLPVLNRAWFGLFIIFPAVVIGLYLVRQFFKADFFDIVPPRDFSLYERLLTEPRILFDYLQNWFIPKLYTTGVYQDHVVKSTGLLAPPITLLAIAFHAIVIAASLIYRRKQPLIALAALFFYGGHLIESTVLNLELYFEHRNYLSAAFLFVPLVAGFYQGVSWRVFLSGTLLALIVLTGFTRYSATIWESEASIVEASAHKAPTSARAQAQYANLLFNARMPDQALQTIDSAIENIPHNNTLLRINRLIILCNINQLSKGELQMTADIVSVLPFDPRLVKVYNNFAKATVEGRCPNIDIASLEPMFTRMLDVPANSDSTALAHSHILFLIGYVQIYSRQPSAALQSFSESLQAQPGASHAMAMAALMASEGYLDGALTLSDLAFSFLKVEEEIEFIGTRVQESDIREFQATVRKDLNEARSRGSDDPAP